MSEKSREAQLNDAFVTLADTLIADYDVIDLLHTLMNECVSLLNVQAGGLVLADTDGTLELVASTSEQVDFIEIMQLAAGSGPCIDSFTTGQAVAVADIEHEATRWPAFCEAALKQGFHSAQATPLRLRDQTIGSMNLFATRVGALGAADAAVAKALADVATIGILQERLIHERNIVTEQLQRALDSRILIEQAKGVLSELGSIDMSEAFIELRKYSRTHNLALRNVAEGVVNRSLDILDVPETLTPKTGTR
ncbi:GAF and ANTAR domain-containing protein [Humibacter antri]